MDNATNPVDSPQLSWADYVDRLEAAALEQLLEKRKRQRARGSREVKSDAAGKANAQRANTQKAQNDA